jgi:CTP synthase
MPAHAGIAGSGGIMRLGAFPCHIASGTLLGRLYNAGAVNERHRHRYEVNNKYRDIMTRNGLVACGTSPDDILIEAVELPDKRFFIGVQFHPEFKSRPNKPHPLFLGFVRAALGDDCA